MKSLTRTTKETRVTIALGEAVHIETGKPFFNHMLSTFAHYAQLPLVLTAEGDLVHHLMEDVALTLGTFVQKLLPPCAARYGERTIPMDDALVQAVLDAGGRGFFHGELPGRLYTHFFRSFACSAGITLHLRVLHGEDRHHLTEAAFKATGMALRDAMQETGILFSTKGAIQWEETS